MKKFFIKFVVYPNPYSTGELRIENGVGLLQIFNAQGSVVYTANITSTATTLQNLNLTNGIYLVKAGKQVVKLVVR